MVKEACLFAVMTGLLLALVAPLDTLAAGAPASAQEKEMAALFKAGDFPAIVQLSLIHI